MDNHLVRVPIRHTGRLLAVLMLMVALVMISLAPMVSAETVVPAATVLGDKPAGDCGPRYLVVPGQSIAEPEF